MVRSKHHSKEWNTIEYPCQCTFNVEVSHYGGYCPSAEGFPQALRPLLNDFGPWHLSYPPVESVYRGRSFCSRIKSEVPSLAS